MKTLISVLQILLVVLLPVIGLANTDNDIAVNTSTDEWTLYTTVDGVEVYFKSSECHQVQKGMHKEYVLLQLVNTTNTAKKIEWDNQLWYDGTCLTCDGNEEHRARIVLKENETIAGDCEIVVDSHLRIFSKFLNYDDKPELTEFKISNIKVETK